MPIQRTPVQRQASGTIQPKGGTTDVGREASSSLAEDGVCIRSAARFTRAMRTHMLSLTHRNRIDAPIQRSEEHTSELQSLMRISYAVFCLKKKKTTKISNKLIRTKNNRPNNTAINNNNM